jgi:hypothetical protein
MVTNKETNEMIRESFENMQRSLNEIEKLIQNDVELNPASIGWHFGSIRENFKLLVNLLKIKLNE